MSAGNDMAALAESLKELQGTVQEFSQRFEEVSTANVATVRLGSIFANMFSAVKEQTEAEEKLPGPPKNQ